MDIALLVRLIAAISWFLAFSLVVLNATRGSQAKTTRGLGFAIFGMMLLSLLLTVFGIGVVFIQPSFRGVVTSAFDPHGYRPEPLQPGLHWIFPFAESVTLYN